MAFPYTHLFILVNLLSEQLLVLSTPRSCQKQSPGTQSICTAKIKRLMSLCMETWYFLWAVQFGKDLSSCLMLELLLLPCFVALLPESLGKISALPSLRTLSVLISVTRVIFRTLMTAEKLK